MHNEHVFPSGVVPFSLVPTPGRLKRLDQLSSESVNGDVGGTWNPAARIIIGGSGVTIYGTGGLSGPVTTGKGGKLVLGDNDYPVLSVTQSRVVLFGLRDFYTRRDIIRAEDDDASPLLANTTTYPYLENVPGALTNTGSNAFFFSGGARPTRLVMPIPSRRLAQAGVVTDMRLKWEVSPSVATYDTTATGQLLPGFRVMRIVSNGAYSNAASELFHIPPWQATHAYALGDLILPDTGQNGHQYRVTTAGTSPGAAPNFALHVTNGEIWQDGASSVFYQTEPGPTDTVKGHFCTYKWGASGVGPQDIIAPANCLTNTTIDLTTYAYVLEVWDPSFAGGIPNSIYHSFRMTVGSIGLLRPLY